MANRSTEAGCVAIRRNYRIGPESLHIHHLPILIYSSPQITLLAANFDKDFIYDKCITIALVFSHHPLGTGNRRVTMAPNLMHQRRIASRLTVMPRSANRSSMNSPAHRQWLLPRASDCLYPQGESIVEPDSTVDSNVLISIQSHKKLFEYHTGKPILNLQQRCHRGAREMLTIS